MRWLESGSIQLSPSEGVEGVLRHNTHTSPVFFSWVPELWMKHPPPKKKTKKLPIIAHS